MLLQFIGSKKRLRRAIAAVEMAILTPFLFFIFLVVWDYSRIFYYAIIVENCARNGARWSTPSERMRVRPASLQESTVAGWSWPRGVAQWQPGLPQRVSI